MPPMPQRRRPIRGRRAASIENDHLRVTVLAGGGHIAEILDKATGDEPAVDAAVAVDRALAFDPGRHRDYGGGADAQLLAGIMGHNLCLDIFGGPSDDEARAGLPVHGEASSSSTTCTGGDGDSDAAPAAAGRAARSSGGSSSRDRAVWIRETVENLGGVDRPVGWTQHVTLGPPFLEKGRTEFRASATRSRVFEAAFGAARLPGARGRVRLAARAAPAAARPIYAGLHARRRPSAYTAHLMDPAPRHAFFVAFSPRARLAFGYVWRRADFPWMGIWEENLSRPHAPWNRER